MNLQISLVHLKYFCDSVKLGSLTASARANFVTQSAISQGINKLEMTLKVRLVAHHPNRFRPTPEGEQAYKKGNEILQQTYDYQNYFSENKLLGPLEFASTYSFGISVIPFYLKKFQKQHPEVPMSFQLERNRHVKQMVKQGIVDFGILPEDGALSEFAKREIYKGSFRFYISAKLKPQERNRLNVVMGKFRNNERETLQRRILNKLKKQFTIMELTSWEIVANMAAEGMGIGYIPDFNFFRKEHILSEIDLGIEPIPYHMMVITPKGMRLRQSSEIFLSLIQPIS